MVGMFIRYHTTALMYAAREGRSTVIRQLVESGASVNKQNNRGWTVSCFFFVLFCLNLYHKIVNFNEIAETSLEKEKMLVTSSYAFWHNVFYTVRDKPHHLNHM